MLHINAAYSRNPPSPPRRYSQFPGIFTPHYPGDFDYENFYDNFFNWHIPDPSNDQNYKYPSSLNYNNHITTTEATTTEQFSDSTVSTKVTEPLFQSQEEVPIKNNNESPKEEIDATSKENAKIVDKKAIREDEDIKGKQISSEGDKLSKSIEHGVVPDNIRQHDTIAIPTGNIIVPAISIQTMNQVSSALNPIVSNNPAGNLQGYSTPSLVNNDTANANDNVYRSAPQAVPLNIPHNPVNNNIQSYAYNSATVPNNAMINNIPNSYYLVSNSQAIPLNNALQTQTSSQIYALVPINNLASNTITNQPSNFVNQQLHINQPNNYVPLMNQPNYVTFNSQPTNFIPLNNQGNQYVSNQPNNLVRFNQPNNMVAVNNNQLSSILPMGNQPNNYVILNSQPSNVVAVTNQPDNVVALSSAGNIPFIVQPQPQPNIVLYPLKEDKEDNSDKKDEEMEKKISDQFQEKVETHPSEESIEVVDA